MPCATSTKIKERDIMSNLTRKENSSYLVLKDQIAALTWVKEKIPITLRFSAKMLAQFRRSLLPSLPSKVCSKK